MTGLYKMGHRYYDPTLSRFTQPLRPGNQPPPRRPWASPQGLFSEASAPLGPPRWRPPQGCPTSFR
ncbi:hypothetical protein [Streptomyces sp. H62]